MNNTPTHKAAVLAVMAYLFDRCEIFEDAKSVCRHDFTFKTSCARLGLTGSWWPTPDVFDLSEDDFCTLGGGQQAVGHRRR